MWVDLWFAKIQFADSGPDFHYHIVQESRPMPTSPCSCFVLRDSSSAVMRPRRRRMLLFAFNSRPCSDNGDDPVFPRPTSVLGRLSLLWKRWRSPLMYVQADIVVRWQSDFAGSGHVYREGTGVAAEDPRRPSRFDV